MFQSEVLKGGNTQINGTFGRNEVLFRAGRIKINLNGWVTGRRFKDESLRTCRIGCTNADDSIEHYAHGREFAAFRAERLRPTPALPRLALEPAL